ncbi:MAG TPA: hypothetical protein P5104_04125, partial [Bacteroidales bacterium]|nr:hypothetical protein [Bacteroidales bacterium]
GVRRLFYSDDKSSYESNSIRLHGFIYASQIKSYPNQNFSNDVSSSTGSPPTGGFQAEGRGFEPHLPLRKSLQEFAGFFIQTINHRMNPIQSGCMGLF